MYADRVPRIISYHDTWISVDPVHGCPYQCAYCVLRHSNNTGVHPKMLVSPDECVCQLLNYPYFVLGRTPLAIGNETDMFHPLNREYLIELLLVLQSANVKNPISLITKAPLDDEFLGRIRAIKGLTIVFFLSYSGLGPAFEPTFTDRQFRENFRHVKAHGFPLLHYWRPLVPSNTSTAQIRDMLAFISTVAGASVITGLKLHPELSAVLAQGSCISIPNHLMNAHGEWLEPGVVENIYLEANRLCPDYPLYRHTSCALAHAIAHPSHTATVFRKDICPSSHCPTTQRVICESGRVIPSETSIAAALSRLGRGPSFKRLSDRIVINDVVNQEEFSYLLHTLNYPLEVKAIQFYNLYRGDIHRNQRETNKVGPCIESCPHED